ncbi:MAG: hypothetical protein COW85_03875 [Ignavibacteria bacterium CG22_combo_CG10-13_8_21_14_all_37_15]|nr:MAG: hypothetical protein COW85_03875 [Ignavibacteria bacterium CG22_combo_CG10-13_8_21_14_all_37_15]PIX94470.1 MAG: hypothetical protein COZ25_05370 [Ignavibacteria bacterium CG_4_10_14_3_um_filter_37_18]
MNKKRFLFFVVHPSKYHVFRHTINILKSKGHQVDILITSKDVLEELIKNEGWEYKNIFPEGRKIAGIPTYLSSGINLLRTIFRLYKYTRKKKYDLFITDDLLVYIGKLKSVPTIVFTDDDLYVTRLFSIVLSMATHILSPDITNIEKYTNKKISFPGYKELAYLHPNVFTPNSDIIKHININLKPFFIIRLVSLSAYHDVGKKGLSNIQVKKLIKVLEAYGNVFISAERNLPNEFEKYRLHIKTSDISHYLYFAKLFIGDSQTMTSEAAVLGTPSFRCNDFVGKISVMEEKEYKYGLTYNYPPDRFEDMLEKINQLLNQKNLEAEFVQKRNKMLNEKINLSLFMIWLFENYQKIDFSKKIDFKKFIN